MIHKVTPILNVSDLEASFAWFEKVGWRKDWDYGDPPDFGGVVSGAGEIFLCTQGQGQSGTWMAWWLESPAAVDAAYQDALANGVTVIREPRDMPWNLREFHIQHPDGHVFRVGASLEEPEEN
jgi:predicted lactoylglutathione lyase